MLQDELLGTLDGQIGCLYGQELSSDLSDGTVSILDLSGDNGSANPSVTCIQRSCGLKEQW